MATQPVLRGRSPEIKAAGVSAGRIYVWEIPVRLTHWINALSIVVLSFTGYYIARPYLAISPQEVYSNFFMGYMRFTHFLFGYIFLASLILRTYWAFVGNQWASWRALVPFLTPEGRGLFRQSVEFYFFARREPPVVLGHNALAGFTYAIIVTLYFIQVFTGFALLGLSDPGGFWNTMTGWVFSIVHMQWIRVIHHVVMWLLIAFAMQHIYVAFLIDAEESNGLISSILTGYKFIVPERHKHNQHDEAHTDQSTSAEVALVDAAHLTDPKHPSA